MPTTPSEIEVAAPRPRRAGETRRSTGAMRRPAATRRRALARAAAVLLGVFAPLAVVAVDEALAGIDKRYGVFPATTAIDPAAPVIVTEYFSYGCVHCFRALASMEKLEAELPDGVELRRLPVVFRDSDVVLAKAYFIALELEVLDRVHRPLFEQVHVAKRQPANLEALADTLQRFGIPRADTERLYDSREINARVRYAGLRQRQFGVKGTPLLVVDDRWWTSPRIAPLDFLGVAGVLIDVAIREREAAAR